MTDWMIWFAVACVLIIFEMASGTFYLVMIAIGAATGGIVALSGASGSWQCVLAGLVAAVATYALRRSRFAQASAIDAAHDANINLDIGQTLEVAEWRIVDGATSIARVMYRGAMWDVDLVDGGSAVSGVFRIVQVQGNRLQVINNDISNK